MATVQVTTYENGEIVEQREKYYWNPHKDLWPDGPPAPLEMTPWDIYKMTILAGIMNGTAPYEEEALRGVIEKMEAGELVDPPEGWLASWVRPGTEMI